MTEKSLAGGKRGVVPHNCGFASSTPSPRLQTAAEALEAYRGDLKYAGDDPMVTPEDIQHDAHLVLQLARSESIPLEELVPDAKEREVLVGDAKEYDRHNDLEDPRAV